VKLDQKIAWIVAARISPPAAQPDCCDVCGFTFELAHAHHIVPLAAQYDAGYKSPNHERVWLCPNHHAIVHYVLRKMGSDATDDRLARTITGCCMLTRDSPSDNEVAKIISLVRRAKAIPS
jgi:hypothetical protein